MVTFVRDLSNIVIWRVGRSAKLLFTACAVRVWEIPIEGKTNVFDALVYSVVKALYGLATGCDVGKGFVQLCQSPELNPNMKLRDVVWAEAKLAPSDAVVCGLAIAFEITEKAFDSVGEICVMHAFRKIAPDVIDVQALDPY